LNSRPTVYEPSALLNDLAPVARLKAHARALPALEGLGRGDSDLAGAVLTELAIARDGPARDALAEAAAGRWSRSVDVLAALAQEALDLEMENLVAQRA